ncbi:hypothetical protein DFP72DRAFT_1169879 [Ephemerocybe angulata]|uniref:Uncharacterized protein n=1 Tax=Ephemerocybe angulata TaxID=980116 RepID=A0A8H6HYM9_9AGAR|nr:hypothetical protein DFP72DRAFT_1169879 [Tulosesus angulatus]
MPYNRRRGSPPFPPHTPRSDESRASFHATRSLLSTHHHAPFRLFHCKILIQRDPQTTSPAQSYRHTHAQLQHTLKVKRYATCEPTVHSRRYGAKIQVGHRNELAPLLHYTKLIDDENTRVSELKKVLTGIQGESYKPHVACQAHEHSDCTDTTYRERPATLARRTRPVRMRSTTDLNPQSNTHEKLVIWELRASKPQSNQALKQYLVSDESDTTWEEQTVSYPRRNGENWRRSDSHMASQPESCTDTATTTPASQQI